MTLSEAFVNSMVFSLFGGAILLLTCLLFWFVGLIFGPKNKISEKIQHGRLIIFFSPAFYLGAFCIIFPAIALKAGINPILAFVVLFGLCVALIICCSRIHEHFYPGDYGKIKN